MVFSQPQYNAKQEEKISADLKLGSGIRYGQHDKSLVTAIDLLCDMSSQHV